MPYVEGESLRDRLRREGSNPSQQQWLVGQHLPAERAQRCPSEYQEIQRSLTRLLEPHWVAGTPGPTSPGQTPAPTDTVQTLTVGT